MSYYNFEVSKNLPEEDEHFMRLALNEAQKAFALQEIPIGAVIVCNGKVIGRGHNLTEQLNDVTAHAEIQAFTAASQTIGGKYLKNCTLYVTIEPCVMCAGASYWTQLGRVVYGAREEKRGFTRINENILHPKTLVTGGVLAEECGALMTSFFKQKRKEFDK
ncbi:nucleoside deaminase [Pedobacter insulae]|uniref:tRNA-specific adenosine deaminase n=1 Tax=Pedobacter insulae TaxID=414048 RepID=A0A1I2X5Z9_9SPHI|nr:nucleoside deaminase [Pedobacter insulae]SFH08964.1 tRNA(adenine34) deaminase [Pedobacter insulae]